MRAAAVLSGLAIAAATLSGCGSDEPAATPASSSLAATAAPGDDLGKAYEFTSDRGPIGAVRITEITQMPADCLLEPPTGTPIGIRVELENLQGLQLEFGGDLVQVNDAGGFTHDAKSALMDYQCKSQYPELAEPPAPGKATGWVFLDSPVTPAALVYTPLVWAEDASLENFNHVPVSPDHVVVRLPAITAAAPAEVAPTIEPEPTTTEPAPTTTRAVPAAAEPAEGESCDIDSDTWAIGADGGQLRCAYAGAPTPRWVASMPFVGIREEGSPCQLGEAVAETPAGVPMVCVGGPGTGEWQPGP